MEDWKAWFAVGVVAAVFVLLATTSAGAHLLILGGVTVLLVAGVLAPADALSGFSNEGMITVAALFVVVAGLRQTGVLASVVQRMLGRPRSPAGAQARLMFPVAFASAFLNNTPIVAMLMPVVVDWARSIRVAASRLLIPLSFATVLGGLCTTIGTSTNLIVCGLLTDTVARNRAADGTLRVPGLETLSLFDIAPVGLPLAVAGLAYLLLVGRRLLPENGAAEQASTDPREYTLEMVVAAGGPLVGRSIQEGNLRHLPGVFLVEIYRGGHVMPAVRPDEILQAGDQLIFAGLVDAVVDLQRIPGLASATQHVFKLDIDGPRVERVFAEAVVSPACPVVGKTVRDAHFRTRYNAVVLAVSRNGERIRKRIGDIVLQPGDSLLMETTPSFVEQQRNARDFYLVTRLEGAAPPTQERAPVALAIVVGMVVLAGFGVLSMLQAALLAGALMLLTRCCSEETAMRDIDWPLLLAIAGAFGLGKALEVTGAASGMAHALVGWAGQNPRAALAVVYGVTMVLTELVTNNAAAVIMFPIALAAAAGVHASPMPFVLAVMMAASNGYASPLGYQTHLMVYGAGHYKFVDFLRIGLPLDALLWLVSVFVIPLAFPF